MARWTASCTGSPASASPGGVDDCTADPPCRSCTRRTWRRSVPACAARYEHSRQAWARPPPLSWTASRWRRTLRLHRARKLQSSQRKGRDALSPSSRAPPLCITRMCRWRLACWDVVYSHWWQRKLLRVLPCAVCRCLFTLRSHLAAKLHSLHLNRMPGEKRRLII